MKWIFINQIFTNFHYIKTKSSWRIIIKPPNFQPFLKWYQVKLNPSFSNGDLTFSNLIKHLEYMQEIDQNSHKINKIHGLKLNHSIKDQDQEINSLFSFATPKFRKLLTHTWI